MKSLMFWKILRYMKTRMKQIVGTNILMILTCMITGIVVQADEWNDLKQDTSHTVDSNDNHAGNNNMLKHT